MTPFRRLALSAGSALALCLAQGAFAAPQTNAWPQASSDLKADARVTYGVLPNGMRYAIMHNTTPTKEVSLRLRIGSGSLEETDAQQGLAHFLEHMAFKGSTHVAEGDVKKILERHGLQFGADTNAFTGFDETVYQFDMPLSEPDALDTGLMLMREAASELTLAAAAMEPERGVVESEQRLGDTPARRSQFDQRWLFLMPDQLASHRFPIGKVDVLQHAPVGEIAAYYREHYRPEAATLIVVGDIDPKAVESMIKAKFSDWRDATPTEHRPDLGAPKPRKLEATVYSEPGLAPVLWVDWVHPHDNAPDSVAKRARNVVRELGLSALSRRLDKLAHAPDAPFVQAGVNYSDYVKSLDAAGLVVVPKPREWKKALAAADAARRQVLQYGLAQTEVDREIAEMRTNLQAAVDGVNTRRSRNLAAGLVQAVNDDRVFTSPEDALARFEATTKGLKAETVNAALREAFSGSGPLVYFSSPTPLEGGDAALADTFRVIDSSPIAAPKAETSKTWTHTSFGPLGQVVERRESTEAGATFVRFANGVRLTVKPTKFEDKKVQLAVNLGGGLRERPPGASALNWAIPAFLQGGLTDLTVDEIDALFADKAMDLNFGANDAHFVFSGSAKTADLAYELQQIAAFMTAPGFRPQAFDQQRASQTLVRGQVETAPMNAWQVELQPRVHGNDRRWAYLATPAELAAAKPDDLKTLLAAPLTKEAVEVEIVGDITVDQAIAETAKTLGALPKRETAFTPTPANIKVTFPASAGPVILHHKGQANQSVVSIGWPTVDGRADPQTVRIIGLTQQILLSRLFEVVRVQEGAAYAPMVFGQNSRQLPGFGYTIAGIETPPDKIDAFRTNLARITADMAEKGVTQDELDRARKPQIEGIDKARQTNGYWLGALRDAQTDPQMLDLIKDAVPGLEKITTSDIQRAAKTYFTTKTAWTLELVPEEGARLAAEPVKP
ncbi:MAG: insulinase family protein [Pseudomonadota bacterium]|jgi:zinc protease